MSKSAVSFNIHQNCVHCGLCLPTCPTYDELGNENDSPRGRIYLMQAASEGRLGLSPKVRQHLDLCLDCRACETVCPSGVEYGRMLEAFRGNHPAVQRPGDGPLDRVVRWMTVQVLPHRGLTRWLVRAVRLLEVSGLFEFLSSFEWLSPKLGGLRLAQAAGDGWARAERLPVRSAPAQGSAVGSAALFVGCVNEALTPSINRATRRVMLRNGWRVDCPRDQVCCGALHHHMGDRDRAAHLARQNIDAFESAGDGQGPIVVNAAGCGVMLRDYDRLLKDDPHYAKRACSFASRVRDIHEQLMETGVQVPRSRLDLRVTYHDACHLCHGQGIRVQPREMLRLIPGVEVVEMRESSWCCGAAGSYSLTQPEMAGRLARRKLGHVERTEAGMVAAANVGCILHLRQHAAQLGRELRIVHPVEVLDEAYALEMGGN